ncbi:hypothetical protein L1047_00255 [Synechococcus sp. Nb3U1]|uniref:hypothetical protein n=1 Tax=Synechococcus sp. Nb3U1 TaxID=1914529 RepID=UPI001F3B7C57|nr:hypothetical protein [Synechococcus sp. Nb3U1]MCF2969629.1 hypothetical protein [Synechococcus sp. Nb3U1]
MDLVSGTGFQAGQMLGWGVFVRVYSLIEEILQTEMLTTRQEQRLDQLLESRDFDSDDLVALDRLIEALFTRRVVAVPDDLPARSV